MLDSITVIHLTKKVNVIFRTNFELTESFGLILNVKYVSATTALYANIYRDFYLDVYTVLNLI